MVRRRWKDPGLHSKSDSCIREIGDTQGTRSLHIHASVGRQWNFPCIPTPAANYLISSNGIGTGMPLSLISAHAIQPVTAKLKKQQKQTNQSPLFQIIENLYVKVSNTMSSAYITGFPTDRIDCAIAVAAWWAVGRGPRSIGLHPVITASANGTNPIHLTQSEIISLSVSHSVKKVKHHATPFLPLIK